MKRFSFFVATIIGALSFVSCSTDTKPVELTVLYTTDLHGSVLPYDFTQNKPATTSLANVAAFVKEQREENKDGVILLDAGDFLQGQPSIYYANFVDTTSEHLQARVMEFVGYDAAAVGNHDIEPGAVVYDKVQEEFDFPWLAANAIDVRTNEPYFEAYTVIERKGVKIAILGMITPNIAAWLPKYLWENITFADMVETAEKWVPIIQEKEKPDLLIGLFHSGSNPNSGGQNMDTYMNENGGIPVATKVDGFDIVLLGHDHQLVSEIIENNFGNKVVVLDALTQAKKVGVAKVKMTKTKDGWNKEITPEMVDMATYTPDPEFVETFQADVDEVNAYVDEPIGVLTETLTSDDALFGPSEFMDLIHNAQLEATGADISIAGVLSSNAVIEKGDLTMRHLFSLYKYENLLYTMSLTGQEIIDFLEFGFDRQYNTMKDENDNLLKFKKDENGNPIPDERFGFEFTTPTFNFISAAGIKHNVDVRKGDLEKVEIISMSDGSKFDPNKRYNVAINSYQASGGGDFIEKGLGFTKEEAAERVTSVSEKDVRQYIADYIIKNKVITPESRNDWKVVPEAYFEKGMAKDKAMVKSK